MPKPLILLSIPALREKDVAVMPRLRNLTAGGEIADLTPGFPCVTCPVQAAMTTGRRPAEHGIVANGIYWREKRQVEMWTAPNDCIGQPQIWDLLGHHGRGLSSAVWFPLHSRGCEADYICTPAPIHNPDGSESLWCYTRPTELYGTLRDELGHFPLVNYWGPLASIQSSRWIADSAVLAARQWQPDFFYIYLPALDYAAQRSGPESAAADQAVADLDEVIGKLAAGMAEAYDDELLWLVAGEYAITPVDHVELSQPRAARGRSAGRPRGARRRASRLGAKPGVRHGRSPILPRFRGRWRPAACRPRGRPVPRPAGHCRGARGHAARPLQPGTSPQRRSHPDFHAAKLAGVLLVAFRRSGAAVRPHGRYPPQAGLRSGGVVLRSGHQKHPPGTPPASKARTASPAADRSQRSVLLGSEPGLFPGPSVEDIDVFGVVLKHFGLQ